MCYRIIASGRMGGIKTKSTGSPAFFHPKATLASLSSPIFLFILLHLGTCSQANHFTLIYLFENAVYFECSF